MKDKVEDQKVIAQINTGGLGQQGLITDYLGEGIKAMTDPAASKVVTVEQKNLIQALSPEEEVLSGSKTNNILKLVDYQ